MIAVAAAFLCAVAVAFVFGYRAGRHARHLRWAHEPIRPWMSVPFIAHTHHIPPDALFQAIGVQPRRPRDRRPLGQIAQETHRPVDELIHELEKAIATAGNAMPGKAP